LVWSRLSKKRIKMLKRDVQPGNRRAPEPSFYAKALDEAEQLELEEAAGIEGLDLEIALLRLKLRELLEQYPDKVELQLKAVNTFIRLVHARYEMTPEQKKNLRQAITTVLQDVAIPLGIKFLPQR